MESKPFRLKAGISWPDKTGELIQVKDGAVRLITQKEKHQIEAGPASHKEDKFLQQSIVRLGPLTNAELHADGWKIIEALPAATVEQLKEEIKNLASGGEAAEVIESATSEPFDLKPGVLIDGERITACRVRLLTRGDFKAIANAGSEQEQQDIQISRQVASFGEVTDRNKIAAAIESLTLTDALRIGSAHQKLLEANAAEPASTPAETTDYDIQGTEILSGPFNLTHGVLYQGRLLKSCVVRLVSRGEMNAALQLPDAEQSEVLFCGSIAELGDLSFDRSREMAPEKYELLSRLALKLTTEDGGRIAKEVDALRLSFRTEGTSSSADNDDPGEGSLGDPVSDQAEPAE